MANSITSVLQLCHFKHKKGLTRQNKNSVLESREEEKKRFYVKLWMWHKFPSMWHKMKVNQQQQQQRHSTKLPHYPKGGAKGKTVKH